MEIKIARQRLMEEHPTQYTLAFDVTQWNHRGNTDGPVRICDTTEDPYRLSFPGFLLVQHGVSPKRLCVEQNEPGVVYENHHYPQRYFPHFPKEMQWWADGWVTEHLLAYIAGDMKKMIFPEITLGSATYHQILTRINDAQLGLTRDNRYETLSESWRAFWLREVTRVGAGIGIQFHHPRNHVHEARKRGS